MIWIALAAMTGLAMAMVLWPLAFRRRDGVEVGGAGAKGNRAVIEENRAVIEENREAAFYRAQLAEIARDVERGQLPADEAASARAEAGRRLIAVAESRPQAVAPGALWRRRFAALVIFVAVPAVGLAVYIKVGQPELPDAPLAQRQVERNSSNAVEAAVAKVEAHLMKEPGDRRGWEVLAPVYMKLGRFDDAAGAYRRTIALGDQDPATHAELGQALVAMANGVVTAEAHGEFEQAPDLAMSKFYLAVAAEQDGKTDEAKAAYKALEPQAKGQEPWMLGLRARLDAMNGGGPPLANSAPPLPEAAAPNPGAFAPDQQKMIETMVQGLADRLAKQGGSSEEWGRLIRAYSVLHEQDKARDALASARKALGQNADIDALAKELGI
jgi:cytochrome c-type biogenesis protein CcmH